MHELRYPESGGRNTLIRVHPGRHIEFLDKKPNHLELLLALITVYAPRPIVHELLGIFPSHRIDMGPECRVGPVKLPELLFRRFGVELTLLQSEQNFEPWRRRSHHRMHLEARPQGISRYPCDELSTELHGYRYTEPQ